MSSIGYLARLVPSVCRATPVKINRYADDAEFLGFGRRAHVAAMLESALLHVTKKIGS